MAAVRWVATDLPLTACVAPARPFVSPWTRWIIDELAVRAASASTFASSARVCATDGVFASSVAAGSGVLASCADDTLEISKTPRMETANVLIFIVQSPFNYRFQTT